MTLEPGVDRPRGRQYLIGAIVIVALAAILYAVLRERRGARELPTRRPAAGVAALTLAWEA